MEWAAQWLTVKKISRMHRKSFASANCQAQSDHQPDSSLLCWQSQLCRRGQKEELSWKILSNGLELQHNYSLLLFINWIKRVIFLKIFKYPGICITVYTKGSTFMELYSSLGLPSLILEYTDWSGSLTGFLNSYFVLKKWLCLQTLASKCFTDANELDGQISSLCLL